MAFTSIKSWRRQKINLTQDIDDTPIKDDTSERDQTKEKQFAKQFPPFGIVTPEDQ